MSPMQQLGDKICSWEQDKPGPEEIPTSWIRS